MKRKINVTLNVRNSVNVEIHRRMLDIPFSLLEFS